MLEEGTFILILILILIILLTILPLRLPVLTIGGRAKSLTF